MEENKTNVTETKQEDKGLSQILSLIHISEPTRPY